MILRKIVFRHVNRRLNSARTAREYWLQVKKREERERQRQIDRQTEGEEREKDRNPSISGSVRGITRTAIKRMEQRVCTFKKFVTRSAATVSFVILPARNEIQARRKRAQRVSTGE